MGIFIGIGFSKSLTQKEWEPVYEETLKLVDAFPLAETRREEINGISTYCLTRTKERIFTHRFWGGKEESYVGWCAVGDYQTMKTAEDHMLVRELVNDAEINPDAGDAIMEFLPSYLPDDFDYDTEEHDAQWDRIWDGKTQGEPYHMLLLAIACTIQARLGDKAYVQGDITWGQCRRAVEIANEVLDVPISMPDQCDLERFFTRVDKLPLNELLKYKVFQKMYLGPKDAEFGSFMREKYTHDTLIAYWKERFEGLEIGSTGYHSALKDFLMSGYGLRDLCEVVDFTESDDETEEESLDKENIAERGDSGETAESADARCEADEKKDSSEPESKSRTSVYERFVISILDAKLHQKEKNTNDYLDISPEQENPYSVGTLFAQFFFGGARNKKIDRYIPLEEIRESLKECIDDKCNVDAIIDAYIKKETAEQAISYDKIMGEAGEDENARDERLKAAVEQDASEVFDQAMDAKINAMQEQKETYDITDWEDTVFYRKGNSIIPGIYDQLKGWFTFYNGIAEEEVCNELLSKSVTERCSYLVEHNRSIWIRDRDWQKIFDDIAAAPESFRRYYPMVRVRVETAAVRYIVTAIMINDDFYALCKDLLAER